MCCNSTFFPNALEIMKAGQRWVLLIPALKQRQIWTSKFQDSLVYRVSSRTAKATKQNRTCYYFVCFHMCDCFQAHMQGTCVIKVWLSGVSSLLPPCKYQGGVIPWSFNMKQPSWVSSGSITLPTHGHHLLLNLFRWSPRRISFGLCDANPWLST